MAIPKGYKKNFETLIRAVRNEDTALVQLRRRDTKEDAAVICAIQQVSDGSSVVTPLAMLFDENPFELLEDLEASRENPDKWPSARAAHGQDLYRLGVLGSNFRQQRELLHDLIRNPRPRLSDDEVNLLFGLENLLDAIADQAHDVHGIDCLLAEDDDEADA